MALLLLRPQALLLGPLALRFGDGGLLLLLALLLLGALALLLGPLTLRFGDGGLFLLLALFLLGPGPLFLGDGGLQGRLLPETLLAGVIHGQEDAQARRRHKDRRGDGEGAADGPLALPALQFVEGDRKHGREEPQLLVLQLLLPVAPPQVGRQGLHLRPVPGFVHRKAQDLREAGLRLPLHQDGQDPVPALLLHEVLELPETPPALQIPGGANGDEPVAVVEGGLDVAAQVGGEGQLLLIPEHPAQLLLARLLADAGGDAVGLDGGMQGLGDHIVGALVPVADEGTVFLLFHGRGSFRG